MYTEMFLTSRVLDGSVHAQSGYGGGLGVHKDQSTRVAFAVMRSSFNCYD